MRKEEGSDLFPGCSKNDSFGMACHTSFGNGDLNKFLEVTAGSENGTDSKPRSPTHPCRALARRCVGEPAGCEAVLILDTSTPKVGHENKSIGRMFNRRNRRMWSRAIWGLKLPGRYYFLTLTTTPESPSLVSVWHNFQRWMKRYRPGIQWLYCFTNEGKGRGVIHMVVRLKMKQKRLDADEVRAYWYSLTGAKQIKIKEVPESKKDDLALYLANQKNKRGLAKEMGYQSAVTRWNRSQGWLPVGFTVAFGRAWVRMGDIPFGLKLKQMSDFLMRYYKDPETWVPGKMEKDTEYGWIFT